MADDSKELESFDDARRAAFIKDVMGFFSRKPVDLLPFEEVKERLHLKHLIDKGIQEREATPSLLTTLVLSSPDFQRR